MLTDSLVLEAKKHIVWRSKSGQCRAPLHEECLQYGDPAVTPGSCGAIGERVVSPKPPPLSVVIRVRA